MIEEKSYKIFVEIEYYKKKKLIVDVLKKFSVDELCDYIKVYKEYMLVFVMDYED